MLKCLIPDYRVDRVEEITIPRLRAVHVSALLLDVDCTLKAYGEKEFAPSVLAWLDALRTAHVGVCLVSNGREGRIRRIAAALDLPYLAMALKPFPFALRKSIVRLGYSLPSTAMVGDQVFADMMAGYFARVTTILVRPIHPEQEPFMTRFKRPVERWVLSHCRSPKLCDL